MDTELLVDDRIDDGAKLIAELVRDGFDVSVAFWVKSSEEGLWDLYIGSSALEARQIGDAARRVYACLNSIPDSSIEFSDIRLVPASSSAAQDAIAIRDKRATRIATRFHGTRLGDLSLEEAYIYPQDVGAMTSAAVLQKVAALMGRAGAIPVSTVILRDGTTIRAIPVRIDRSATGDVQIELRDSVSGTSQMVSANEVSTIL